MAEQQERKSSESGMSRRDFLKLLGAGGTILTFTPFVPWGKFMPNPGSGPPGDETPAILPDGNQANVNTFPINHGEVITYPKTGDPVLDEEAFRKWQLVRLPEMYGGDKNDISSFRAYSMVCLHLWCLWKYWPQEGRKRGECPCHGSMYDVRTGQAIAGPASLQAPPSNVLPRLFLKADQDGFIFIKPAEFGVNKNGVVGYGRFLEA